jgi:HTH-type transcriptional regulator/antitoxin HigA
MTTNQYEPPLSDDAMAAAGLAIADDPYLELIRRCPLRPIRSEAELTRAIAMLDWLVDKETAGLRRTPSEHDYLLVLAGLVEDYEDVHYPMPSDITEH